MLENSGPKSTESDTAVLGVSGLQRGSAPGGAVVRRWGLQVAGGFQPSASASHRSGRQEDYSHGEKPRGWFPQVDTCLYEPTLCSC